MNQQQHARVDVLECVQARQVTTIQAATVLGVSERHLWRLLAAYRKGGQAAIVHGNQGRRPRNATRRELAEHVAALTRSRYPDANHTHLTELLQEREGIDLGRQTLRRILSAAGLRSPRRRRSPLHRVRRERMYQEGMLIQIDGSHHRWLGESGPQLALLLAIDDATGKVLAARMRPSEDARGYFMLLSDLVASYGIPLALYCDRHSVFIPDGRKCSCREPAKTQFSRALSELGIGQIFARSPQAKGRVERAAGTFQDRLVTELRLDGVRDLEMANALLPGFLVRFNARFGVPAKQPQPAYRTLDPDIDLENVFCFKHFRRVGRDNTIKYNWQTLQLLPVRQHTSYAGVKAQVFELVNGRVLVSHQGELIPSQPAAPRAGALRAANGAPALGYQLQQIVGGLDTVIGEIAELELKRLPTALPGKSAAKPRPAAGQPDPRCRPTARQLAVWKAVHKAKRKGLSLRAIARQLGIARDTVAKYARASSPPINRFGMSEAGVNGAPKENAVVPVY